MTVMVDSNVVVGARLQRDQWHQAGSAIVEGVDSGSLPGGIVSTAVLPEILTPIQRRAGDGPARDTLTFLDESRGFALRITTREDLTRARQLFYREDGIEFVDCSLVSTMRRLGVEYLYSFDDDFDRFPDITRLVTADDPQG